jgi:hypothetical protein
MQLSDYERNEINDVPRRTFTGENDRDNLFLLNNFPVSTNNLNYFISSGAHFWFSLNAISLRNVK